MPNENLYGIVDRIKTLYREEKKVLLTENEYLKARIAELEAQLQRASDRVDLAEEKYRQSQSWPEGDDTSDHSQRTTKYHCPMLGPCVCGYCENLPS